VVGSWTTDEERMLQKGLNRECREDKMVLIKIRWW